MDSVPEAECFGQYMNGMFENDGLMIEDIMAMSEHSANFFSKPLKEKQDKMEDDSFGHLEADEFPDLKGKDLDLQGAKLTVEERGITESTATRTNLGI